MSSPWKHSVNQTVGLERINNIENYIQEIDDDNSSPIDQYYSQTQKFITIATPAFLDENSHMGSLFLVSIVSETENYFRNLFSKIIRICPISRRNSSDKNVNLGSVIWHPKDCYERGAFENISFANAKAIRDCSKNYIGFQIDKNSDLETILEEYDKVCEIRHSIVHSGSILAGKNALKLNLQPTTKAVKIQLRYAEFQESASICTTLVATYNDELFDNIATKWATLWRALPSWKDENEYDLFKKIWSFFHSKIDESNDTIVNKLSILRCKNLVRRTIIGT